MAAAPALRLSRRPALLLLAGPILNIDAMPDPIKYGLDTALLTAAVASLPRAPAFLRGGLTSTPLLPFGAESYVIDLSQQPFCARHGTIGGHAGRALVLPAIAAGIASLMLTARPARRFLKRVFDRMPGGRHQDGVKSFATP